MSKISEFLINALRIVVLAVVGILAAVSIGVMTKLSGDSFLNKFFILEMVMFATGSFVIFSKMRHRYKICILLLMALVLRMIWILSINTLPISDFNSMYEGAKRFLTGDTSIFKGYSYLARFPHLIPMTFYMSLIIKIFPIHNLIAMKILNVMFGCISVYLMYKLSDNFIKSEKNKLFVLLLGAIFAPLITYTSVLCTENIAIPLYLATLIMFYKSKSMNTNQTKYFILTGGLLAISNLFRGVAAVFLIAFSIYILLDSQKRKLINIGSIILGYIIITVAISGTLLKANILERPLWNGAEPSTATLLLKGSNFEHNGMWNIDDAQFVDKHLRDGNLTELCLEKVKERILSKTPKEIFTFYAKKFGSQWGSGDSSGTYWAYTGANITLSSAIPIGFQFIYVLILVFSFISLLKNENKALLNIVLFGFGLLFIIIETQSRYSYIVNWIFVIFAAQGIEMTLDFVKKGKLNGWKFKKKNI